jgi:hypothetical protein
MQSDKESEEVTMDWTLMAETISAYVIVVGNPFGNPIIGRLTVSRSRCCESLSLMKGYQCSVAGLEAVANRMNMQLPGIKQGSSSPYDFIYRLGLSLAFAS